MSLTVKHLNADSTFLLTFRPHPPSTSYPFPPSPGPVPASFSIIIDPWLTGPSTIYHSKFAISRHRHPPCIASLRDLPEPDLIIISQAKPDHCHEETLRRLPAGDKNTKTTILAHPGAAKIIRSWNHFPPEKVQTLRRYDPKRDEESLWRFKIPPTTPTGTPGEVTVALMQKRLDITGVHSAIGITYQPPTTPASTPHLPPFPINLFPPSPPDSPGSVTLVADDMSDNPSDRPLSVLYSPHGISHRSVQPWASDHLRPLGGVPLTLLLHSFDEVRQPWFLGGTISRGLPGGLKLAELLRARSWIAAHDEDKFNAGVVGVTLETRKYDRLDADDVWRRGDDDARRHHTEMHTLDSGAELLLDADVGRERPAGSTTGAERRERNQRRAFERWADQTQKRSRGFLMSAPRC
ncbi:MAG: hypothetical protein M1816_007791 [Peltula sp. TS41687]|nr:MAG: hypothetical protein M1816_007791 [Peltula sp. TS41687]